MLKNLELTQKVLNRIFAKPPKAGLETCETTGDTVAFDCFSIRLIPNSFEKKSIRGSVFTDGYMVEQAQSFGKAPEDGVDVVEMGNHPDFAAALEQAIGLYARMIVLHAVEMDSPSPYQE